jgi:hypothetical protein
MAILLLLASLSREYKEFNRIQTKGNLPMFHETEARLLDNELTLRLEAEKDELSEAMFLNKVPASSKSNTTSKNSNVRSDPKSKSNSQRHESRSGPAKRKQSNHKKKSQKTQCGYCNDPTCKGRFFEE